MNVLEIITKVVNILGRNAKSRDRYASELDNFRNRKIQANSNTYRLGVIGVTSSGKSTMINSLLGEFLLPAAARPSSSQLVSCFHSRVRSARIYFQDGTSKVFSGGSLNQKLLEKYGDEGQNAKNKESVKQIELSTPDFPFNDNIILIDSPGLDAYGYDGHEQLTMNSLLPTIDFCIFVTTCKTNSDDKMLSVLNTIAEYEKPVIIVQNMIDSLKPSLDGKKSVADVAQDHRVRVERIINRSNVKDKSKVHIVQISAVNALKARQNRLISTVDKDLLEKSNYKKLVEVVGKAFDQVRPIVEGNRLLFLKKEILRIAQAALADGAGAQDIVSKFEYENIATDYENKKSTCILKLNRELGKLQSRLSILKNKTNFSEFDICTIKSISAGCEAAICNQMKYLNSSIISICQKLNIDYRNIITDFRFDKPELRLKKKFEVVKDGYWEEGETRFTLNPWRMNNGLFSHKDKEKWVDTSYVQEVADVSATRKNAINYINNSIRIFRQTIERWQKTVDVTENKLYSEIENRRAEYKARLDRALDSQTYLQIGEELREIANSISVVFHKRSNINKTKTDIRDTKTYSIRVNSGILFMYKLSDLLRRKIHTEIHRCFTSNAPKNIIVGWDENCESRFMLYALNQSINSTCIKVGCNIWGDSTYVYHKQCNPLPIISGIKNVYILVNATQFGAAMSEISKLKLQNCVTRLDHVYFVIQDFQEIINGDSVVETLTNVLSIRNYQGGKVICSCNVLLLHDNPIYNLAAAEAQTIGCTKQYDEIRILNSLQTKFGFLFPRDRATRNNVETIILQIIQKLGEI